MVPNTRTSLRTDRLRALNIPQPVQVEVGEHGYPVMLRGPDDGGQWKTTEDDGRPLSCHSAALPLSQRIEEVIEIWRIDDEWWREPIHRRYIDVVLEGGGHVVLFEDLTTGQWFLQKP